MAAMQLACGHSVRVLGGMRHARSQAAALARGPGGHPAHQGWALAVCSELRRCLQIAEAPKVRQVQQVHGLEQLEDAKLRNLKQFISGAGSAAREGDGAEPAIDLSLLLSALLPEHLVREPDEVWDEELLLTKVAAELQAPGERPERPSMAVQSS